MFYKDNNERPDNEKEEMVSTFNVVVRTPFPKNCNPMMEDQFHMGVPLGTNLMVLHHSHPSEVAKYVILVHIPTGHRIQINFPEAEDNVMEKTRRYERILNEREQW